MCNNATLARTADGGEGEPALALVAVPADRRRSGSASRSNESYPGTQRQNGAHERMHRTLMAETARPPEQTKDRQQKRLDELRHVYTVGASKPRCRTVDRQTQGVTYAGRRSWAATI